MTSSVMWFRRDLRLADNPALLAAIAAADDVLPVFVLDDRLGGPSGAPRLAFLYACLNELNDALNGNLVVRHGSPADVIAQLAQETEAAQVFCTEDFGPYGRRRDDEVGKALNQHDVVLQKVDSPYAVAPGSVLKGDGTPFQVFTPFSRSWTAHGWGSPRPRPKSPRWTTTTGDGIPDGPKADAELPPPGEHAGAKRLKGFLDTKVNNYKDLRDQPGVGGTSRLSPYLKYGCVHPRQALDKLGAGVGAQTFRNELCWREFYADVLFNRPETTNHAYRNEMSSMKVDEGTGTDSLFDAWANGQTGFPIVDAGMRQLQGEAWVHNRVRMIVASFLIKDLHLDWTRGAQHFMHHLVDGDIASNSHGWQWVAGTGTDAAPYFRVFNPITQGKKFDPDGLYIKKWVPELRNLDTKFVHEPWLNPGGAPGAYPAPIVEHDAERKEALARYAALRA